MKKILLIAAFVALSGGSAFAGGNINLGVVSNTGFFNTGVIAQGGSDNHNTAMITNLGAGNVAGIEQGGYHNFNSAVSVQFGVGNASIITQN